MPSAIDRLLSAGRGSVDRVLTHSLTYALIELTGRHVTARGLACRPPGHAGVPPLIALDQMDGGGLEPETVAPLLASTDPGLQGGGLVDRRPPPRVGRGSRPGRSANGSGWPRR